MDRPLTRQELASGAAAILANPAFAEFGRIIQDEALEAIVARDFADKEGRESSTLELKAFRQFKTRLENTVANERHANGAKQK